MNAARCRFRIAIAGCLALGGCASEVTPAAAPAATVSLPHKDGVYAGARTIRSGGSGCGLDDTVSYQVDGSHIWLRTHRTRRFIDGQIGPDGAFTMLNQAGTDHVSGSISGDRLSATETSDPKLGRHSAGRFSEGACVKQIDARYLASDAAEAVD